jgi:hypothetical protein
MDRRLKARPLVQRWGEKVERKPDEEICLFVRDGQTRRLLFNVKALQPLGINAVEARQRGYPIKEQPPMAEAEEDLTAA